MLESMPRKRYPQQELANRLIAAMDQIDLSQADLARECGVTIQAVHDWRETGRIGKQHLVTISRLTKKPLEYFLVGLGRAAVIAFVALVLAWPPPEASAASLNIKLPGCPNNDCIRLRRRSGWLAQIRDFLTELIHIRPMFRTMG